MPHDVIILGAGAAGLMCAIEAGKRGRRVVLIERATEVGKKILISGGGRCNFTNLYCEPDNFLSENPHFAKSALWRYTQYDFLALVEKHKIAWHEKKLGQLFCDRSASDVVRMLLDECRAAGVDIVLGCDVEEVRHGATYVVWANRGEFRAPALVVATGGLTIPKMGATDFGYRVARQFGLKQIRTRPALVPLTLDQNEQRTWSGLAGVSLDVAAAVGEHSFRENLLVTHRGFSGPAILQISSYWRPGEEIELDLAPEVDLLAEFKRRRELKERTETKTIVAELLPQRFVERWFERNAESKPVVSCSPHELADLAARLHRWKIAPDGTEGYSKAEVTVGGVDTDELSSKTMECRHVPGLFFVGEVVDVTGHLGGFNFQWAWSSGYAAGQAV
jgi:predicted Rossmann fold flavoprotein